MSVVSALARAQESLARIAGAPRRLLGGIVLLALALRLTCLTRAGFNQDELATIHFASQSLSRVLFGPGFDNHPPLYYAFMHIWLSIAGVSEIAMRLPSALMGTLAVGLAFVVGRVLLNDAAGWAGALGSALLPPHLLMSRDARMYEFLAVFALLSAWTMARLVTRPDVARMVAYVMATEAMLYTQVAGVFVVIAQNAFWAVAALFAVLPRERKRVLAWIGVQALVVLLYAPWIVVAANEMVAMQSNYWVRRESVISYLGGLMFWFAGTAANPAAYLLAPAITILMGLACARMVWRRDSARADAFGVGLALALAALPGLGMAIVSQIIQPIFVPRAMLPSAVACYWLSGHALARFSPRPRAMLTALLAIGAIVGATGYFVIPPRTADLRAAISGFCFDARSRDTVYLYGWPEAKHYMATICSTPSDPNPLPRILTSRGDELDTAMRGWCRDPAHDTLYVLNISSTETPHGGLIGVRDYLAILRRENLSLDRPNDPAVGHVNRWRCQRPVR